MNMLGLQINLFQLRRGYYWGYNCTRPLFARYITYRPTQAICIMSLILKQIELGFIKLNLKT